MSIALIPARGGSKRVPHKNKRLFNKHPIISWPIASARASNVFSRVLVSTDDPEIAEIAIKSGAEVPALREAKLADDVSTVSDVISYEIEHFDINEDICLIYATAAGLSAKHLRLAEDILREGECEFVMGVVPYAHPVQRAITLRDGIATMLSPEYANVRTQDLVPLYHDAAQFVFGRLESWKQGRTVWNSQTKAIILDPSNAIDIDTEQDWELAERLLAGRQIEALI